MFFVFLWMINLEGSNACTLIALLMASNMHKSKISVECLFSSPTTIRLTELFSDAILKGNAIHQDLFKTSSHLQNTNLTVPEAMHAGKLFLGTLTEWVKILLCLTFSKFILFYFSIIYRKVQFILMIWEMSCILRWIIMC